jgi:hypothetical protein
MKKQRSGHKAKLKFLISHNAIIQISLINNSIQFFIYLRAELNSRGPITELARNMKTIIQQQNIIHIKRTRQRTQTNTKKQGHGKKC